MKRKGLQSYKSQVLGPPRASSLAGVSAGRLRMRLSKLFAVIVLVLGVSGIALASGIDTQLNVNGGGGGSPNPPLSFNFSATTPNGTGFDGSAEFLPNYVIQSITMSMPAADWSTPFVCLSNAYVVNGGLGVAPTVQGANLVCTFTLGPSDPSEASEGESLFTMQTDCQNSNLGLTSDFDDCVGVSPTSGQDIIYGIKNASVNGAVASVVNTPLPEPGSFSLLFAGLFGLAFMRRKLGR